MFLSRNLQDLFRSDEMLYSPDLLGGIIITKVRRKEVFDQGWG